MDGVIRDYVPQECNNFFFISPKLDILAANKTAYSTRDNTTKFKPSIEDGTISILERIGSRIYIFDT